MDVDLDVVLDADVVAVVCLDVRRTRAVQAHDSDSDYVHVQVQVQVHVHVHALSLSSFLGGIPL